MNCLSQAAAFGLVFMLGVSAAVPAWAQPPLSQRAYRGLFASGVANPRHLLVLNGSFSSGYDDQLEADLTGNSSPLTTSPSASSVGGMLTRLGGSLAYSMTTNKLRLSAEANGGAGYYPALRDDLIPNATGHFNVSGQAPFGLTLTGNTQVTYQPAMFSAIYPTLPELPSRPSPRGDLGFAMSPYSYLTYGVGASINRQISRRATIAATYAYESARVPSFDPAATPDSRELFINRSTGAALTYRVGRGLGVKAGYAYGTFRYAAATETELYHVIDVGVDYARGLSISRRTSLSFSTGSVAFKQQNDLYFTATGDATLKHEMGRTWTASVAYGRQVQFDPNWRDPIVTNGVTAGVGGLISRRLQFAAETGAVLGSVGVGIHSRDLNGYYAITSLIYAFSRHLGVGVVYLYSHHNVDESVALSFGSFRSMDRQSVSAFVNVWAPLFYRARRPDAAK